MVNTIVRVDWSEENQNPNNSGTILCYIIQDFILVNELHQSFLSFFKCRRKLHFEVSSVSIVICVGMLQIHRYNQPPFSFWNFLSDILFLLLFISFNNGQRDTHKLISCVITSIQEHFQHNIRFNSLLNLSLCFLLWLNCLITLQSSTWLQSDCQLLSISKVLLPFISSADCCSTRRLVIFAQNKLPCWTILVMIRVSALMTPRLISLKLVSRSGRLHGYLSSSSFRCTPFDCSPTLTGFWEQVVW